MLVSCENDFMSIKGRSYDQSEVVNLHPYDISVASLHRETLTEVLHLLGFEIPKDMDCLEFQNGVYIELEIDETDYDDGEDSETEGIYRNINYVEAALFEDGGFTFLIIIDDYCDNECTLYILQS